MFNLFTKKIKNIINKDIKFDEYYREFTDELNKIQDFRLKILFLHLNIEYWINKIIEKHFKNPDKILKSKGLRTFDNKVNILESLGILTDHNQIQRIRLTNTIRNYYSHNIIKKGELPKKTKDLIKKILKTQPKLKRDANKFSFHQTHSFILNSICIIVNLHYLYENLKIEIF